MAHYFYNTMELHKGIIIFVRIFMKNYTSILGCMFGSHDRNGNELQPYRCHGSSSNILNLGFEVPINPKLSRKSSKVAWCHVMTHICRGKNIANLVQDLLQTSYKPEPLTRIPVVLIGKRVPLWAKR